MQVVKIRANTWIILHQTIQWMKQHLEEDRRCQHDCVCLGNRVSPTHQSQRSAEITLGHRTDEQDDQHADEKEDAIVRNRREFSLQGLRGVRIADRRTFFHSD